MSAYYITRDPQQVAAFKAWAVERQIWADKVHALGEEMGRQAVTTGGSGHERIAGFELKSGDPCDKRSWMGTEWVMESANITYLRTRANKAGEVVRERIREVGPSPAPNEHLDGIPKRTGMFGLSCPGMTLNADEDALAMHYSTPVEHDDRWTEIKASEWHRLIEERYAEVTS